jgi:uncharacterized protein YycO
VDLFPYFCRRKAASRNRLCFKIPAAVCGWLRSIPFIDCRTSRIFRKFHQTPSNCNNLNSLPYSFILLFNPFIRLGNKIRWRFGRSYKCAGLNVDEIRPLLEPGMVILTHKAYEMTNLFINGYWTHTAIVTSEDSVVEAISRGVVTKPLDKFLTTVDDFLILKPRFCGTESMKSASEHVKRFLGYPYNFTFRSEEDSVYCSELVFRAYSTTPEWDTITRTPAEHVREYFDGRIVLPHSFSESQLLWQHVAPIAQRPEYL